MKYIYILAACALLGFEAPAYNLKPQALGAMAASASHTVETTSAETSVKAQSTAGVQRPWFYAIRNYSKTSAEPKLMKFRAGFTPTPEGICNLPSTGSAYAGTLTGDKYVYADWTVNSLGNISAVNWSNIDPSTGTGSTKSLTVANAVSMDMTYDTSTETIYAISGIYDYLITVDATSAEVTPVAETLPFYTLSCDPAGSLYGITIDADGSSALHSVNKLTGATVKIGDTGVKVYTSGGFSVYQSAEFSTADGKLYWATVSPEGNGVLYRVDISTGQASYLNTFPDSEGFSGMAPMPLEATAGAPASVGEVKAEGDADGRLSVAISFKVPDLTADGEALTEIDEVNIYRGSDEEAVKTFYSPTPGTIKTWTDTDAKQGFNSYRIEAVNEAGVSIPVYASAYCGEDYPTAPTGISVNTDASGRPVVTWSAPTKGLNGLTLDGSKLRYIVTRNVSGTDEIIADNLTECSYTDTKLDITKQEYPYYSVRALSSAGEGLPSAITGTYVGPAYVLPFDETFENCELSTRPWLSTSLALGGAWEMNYISTFPGTGPYADSGMLVFPCFNFVKGAEGRISTPMLSFEGAENPYVSFYFYYLNMESEDLVFDDALQIEVSTDKGKTFTPVEGGLFYQKDANSGWTPEKVSLKAYAGQRDVIIGFRGISDGGFNIMADDIRVEDGDPSGIEDIDVPKSEGPVEYYNLQGVRMSGDKGFTPGVYIRRTPSGSSKVIVR